jgi:hypothetical protein
MLRVRDLWNSVIGQILHMNMFSILAYNVITLLETKRFFCVYSYIKDVLYAVLDLRISYTSYSLGPPLSWGPPKKIVRVSKCFSPTSKAG